MSKRSIVLAAFAVATVALLTMLPVGPADAQVRAFPGIDCTQAPTPDMPGQGLAAFFDRTPNPLPKQADPFAPHAKTTIYEQYGFSGLRWHTYDLGCGPDAARNPDAVIGTALSNWIMNAPIGLTALTSSLTHAAFHPTYLDVFDPTIVRVSSALHRSLFATWIPAVLALLGIAILIKAHRSALATTAAAIGWALMVVLVATAIFRWPLVAGHFADNTVTSTLGGVVGSIDGHDATDPGSTVASNVHDSIFYRSWLEGTLGSTDSATARKYGPDLFKAQALTWHEAYVVEHDPEAGKTLIQQKEDRWTQLAGEVKDSDPQAYEYLTGKRSDTRVGFAFLATIAAFLSLPFLIVSALLLIGAFLVVRLAVMMFPAFATVGAFPASRGIVLGIGRAVGAAVVNSVIFGIGAAVTIRVLGLIFDPASHLPGWLALVLMPLFSFVMWMALKPFRRLTTMVGPSVDPFGEGAGAFGAAGRSARRWARRATATAAGVYTGNVAAAATAGSQDEDTQGKTVPERHEARPAPVGAPALVGSWTTPMAALPAAEAAAPTTQPPATPPPAPGDRPTSDEARGLPEGFVPQPSSEGVPMPPTEPEWYDGEEVYTIYRPDQAEVTSDDAA